MVALCPTPARIAAGWAWAVLSVSLLANPSSASPLLLATGERPFGPGAGGLGGVQAALAGSVDAAWHNPAGLARDPREEAYLDAGALELGETTLGKNGRSNLTALPGAVGWVSGPTRRRPWLGFGFFVHAPVWQSPSDHIDETRTIATADLPPAASGAVSPGAFPGGIERGESGISSGALTIVAAGAGLGVRLSDGLRLGAAVRVERVSLRLREAFTQSYAAEEGGATLSGFTQSSADLAGEANRAVAVVGIQMDVTERVSVALISRQPSYHLGGSGSVRINRTDSLTVSSGGTSTAFTHVQSDHTPFELRSAGSLRLGVGFQSGTMALELDVEQGLPLGAYKVFPALESGPPSTTAARQDALVTRSNGVTRYGIAALFAQDSDASWLFSFATDPSPVPAFDSIFRKMDVYRFTAGYYATRGRFAGAVRLGYETAETPATRFPHLTDSDAVTVPARFTRWTLGCSGSYVF